MAGLYVSGRYPENGWQTPPGSAAPGSRPLITGPSSFAAAYSLLTHTPVLYQGACGELYNDMSASSNSMGASSNSMGALTRDTADQLRIGDTGRSRPSVRSVRWLVSVGCSWSLASAAVALAIATVVIAVADGDLFFISLVPGTLAAALMGGLVAVRRPGHPMGTLLSAYGLAAAVSEVIFAYRAQPLSTFQVRCLSGCRCCGWRRGITCRRSASGLWSCR